MTGLMSAMTMACAAEPGGSDANAGTTIPRHPISLQDATQAARADAAKQTGLAADAFVLISAESVTWSDSSIGCPVPGKQYMQVLVPGYRIRLRGPAGELDYHAAAHGTVSLCPSKQAVDPVPGRGLD